MIVGSDMEHEIGMRYVGPLSDDDGNIHRTPYVVLRESSFEEYCEELRNSDANVELVDFTIRVTDPGNYFYEISTD